MQDLRILSIKSSGPLIKSPGRFIQKNITTLRATQQIFVLVFHDRQSYKNKRTGLFKLLNRALRNRIKVVLCATVLEKDNDI